MRKIYYIFLFLCVLTSFFASAKEVKKVQESPKTFTVMLDPAGDAQNTGRQIDDYLERGITLQFCQKLKKELEQEFDNIRVVLTRFPGESIAHLQNANFANRLDVDFYLSIHFYKEKSVKPRVYIFTFAYQDDFITHKPDLYFYPYDKLHLINRGKTKKCVELIKNVFLSDEYTKFFDLKHILGLPFKPLIAVTAPAVGVEIGLKKRDDWRGYCRVFVDCIGSVVSHQRGAHELGG